jgi:hypothetical protein
MTQEQYPSDGQMLHPRMQPPPQGPPPGYYPPGGYPQYGYQQVALPTVWPTILITFCFGLLGLIPAIMHTNKAKLAGKPTSNYWIAFGCTLVVSFVILYPLITLGLLAMNSLSQQ